MQKDSLVRAQRAACALVVVAAIAVGALAACGIKGPLRLPPPAPGTASPPSPAGTAPSSTGAPPESPEAIPAEPPAAPSQPAEPRKS